MISRRLVFDLAVWAIVGGFVAGCLFANPTADDKSVVAIDISANPADWVNVAYARHFGLGEVRRQHDSAGHDVRH